MKKFRIGEINFNNVCRKKDDPVRDFYLKNYGIDIDKQEIKEIRPVPNTDKFEIVFS